METNLNCSFRHPTSILIAGNSGSGKTHLVTNIITKNKLCPQPEKIFWFYRQYQKVYSDLLAEGYPISFIEGLPDEVSRAGYFTPSSRNLCILDDLHLEKEVATHVAQLFCNAGRHSNTTVIFITQNLFFQHAHGRDIRLNAKYIVCFRNPQDRLQLQLIGRQIYPGKQKFFTHAVEECLERKYGYVILDLNQDVDDKFQIKSCIFGENQEGLPEIHVPAS